jgi:ABC-type Fe3+/spermidine/putrescine transport system ATPase subunit
MNRAALLVKDVHKSFGQTRALAGVSFDIQPGETLALLGPSGCGKSTLLNVIAGLETPDHGEVHWDGMPLAGMPAHKRGFGLMFQDYALFPHLSVARNVAFGLEVAKQERQAIESRVDEMLALVGLEDYAQREPDTLSGGEQQRVALARALAPGPRLLMLDEPLGALDRALREDLLKELRYILQQIHQTALYVTHDQEEAFSIADRVAVMRLGRTEQVGTPRCQNYIRHC